jgi:anti-sigma B factor antagonist
VDLSLSTRAGRDCAVVEVGGELDMATAPRLADCLQRVLDTGARLVIVDLGAVGFMDSSALGMLVSMFKQLRDDGGRLCLADARGPVRAVLALTSVDRVIDVHDSVAAAEAAGAAGAGERATTT